MEAIVRHKYRSETAEHRIERVVNQRAKVYEAMREGAVYRAHHLAGATGLSVHQVRNMLRGLRKMGLVLPYQPLLDTPSTGDCNTYWMRV